MGDPQYGLPDLRQLLAWRSHFQLGTPPRASEEPFFLQSGRNLAPQPPPPPPPPQPQPQAHHHYDSPSLSMVGPHLMLPGGSGFVKLGHHHDHYCTNAAAAGATVPTTSTTSTTTTSAAAAAAAAIAPTSSTFFGVDMESGWAGTDGGNSSRWPRQETLTLLEIRSRLDSRFKEANQKGPLWDEVSRIMAEEHGYQRSGKKCREKFENLYKYYKKTKEGRAGRQDGKHYRFFRQLEALYGETSTHQASASENNVPFATNNSTTATSLYHMATNINNDNNSNYHENQETRHSESLSFSNTSDFETSSSENNDDDLSAIPYMKHRSMGKQKGLADQQEGRCHKRGKKGWKTKVKDFVDSQMTKLLDTQEAWMERMLKTIEERERDRVSREDEWRKQELARFDREHEFWAKERAWIEARDAALMEALKKYSGKGGELLSSSVEQIAIAAAQSHYKNHEYSNISSYRWTESEILSLIQLRSSMEPKFQEESGYSSSKEVLLWEEIAAEMSSLGYDRNVDECKEKWNSMNAYFNMATTTECNKKRKEDLQTGNCFLPAAFKFQ